MEQWSFVWVCLSGLVDASVLFPNFLHLYFLPTAPLEKDIASGHGFKAS